MLSFIKGKVAYKDLDSVEIHVNEIGYEIYVSENELAQIQTNEEIEIFVYHHKSEASDDLYGFLNRKDKKVFKMLISVSGVGPKTALAIFNAGSGEQIMQAVSKADTAFFTKAKGIGTKAAQRIIVDLKSKVENISELDLLDSSYNKNIWEALKGMGFTKSEISRALENVPNELQTEDKIISYALKNLSKYE